MNLIQRMVAENVEYVTSVELANACGITHESFCAFVKENLPDIETKGEPLQRTLDGYVFTVNQTFAVIIFIELSEEEHPTPSDILIAELKRSYIKVFMACLKGHERRTGERIDIWGKFCEIMGVTSIEVQGDEIDE